MNSQDDYKLSEPFFKRGEYYGDATSNYNLWRKDDVIAAIAPYKVEIRRLKRDRDEWKQGTERALSLAETNFNRAIKAEEENTKLRELLALVMQLIREDSDSDDPMEPFAYDSRWEKWAIETDTMLKGIP